MSSLLWLDIETTGLDRVSDRILEIGMVVTDENLVELARKAWIIPYVGGVSDFIAKMHGSKGSGLLAECVTAAETGPAEQKIGRGIAAWLAQTVVLNRTALAHFEKPPLCGSSVHFDRGFVEAFEFCRSFLELVHYRNIDVSTVKELAKRWAPRVYESRPKAAARHRALPDLDDSIAELRHYRAHLFAGPDHSGCIAI